MGRIAIIGAGELGGAIARTLASRGRVGEVRLIDEAAELAAGKALDIQQAGPLERSATRLSSAGDVTAAAGASAIVIADAACLPPQDQPNDRDLALLRRLAALAGETVVILAGASHREVMQRGLEELRLPAGRVIGSAPEALAAALRALAALEADASPANVALSVLGRPPDRIVVPWNEATIAGHALVDVLRAPQLLRLRQRLPALWPPGPYALASAAARIAEAVVLGSRRLFSCFAAIDRGSGARGSLCMWTVALGTSGLERIVMPSLSARDQVLVDGAAEP